MNPGESETSMFMALNALTGIVRLVPPMENVVSANGLLTSILMAPVKLIVPHLIGDLILMVVFRNVAQHGVMTSLNSTIQTNMDVSTVFPKIPIQKV